MMFMIERRYIFVVYFNKDLVTLKFTNLLSTSKYEDVHVKDKSGTIFESYKRKEKYVYPLDIFVI